MSEGLLDIISLKLGVNPNPIKESQPFHKWINICDENKNKFTGNPIKYGISNNKSINSKLKVQPSKMDMKMEKQLERSFELLSSIIIIQQYIKKFQIRKNFPFSFSSCIK